MCSEVSIICEESSEWTKLGAKPLLCFTELGFEVPKASNQARKQAYDEAPCPSSGLGLLQKNGHLDEQVGKTV